MKEQLLRFTLYALIAYLTGSPLNPAVAATQPSVGNGPHFCGSCVVDYPTQFDRDSKQPNKQYADQYPNRNYAQTFAANLNAGEPYTVRLIYFLPNNRQPQPDIDTKMDRLIKDVQQSYAEIMEKHGFGGKTFRLETDATGQAVVHHMKGKFNDAYYHNPSWVVWDEIVEQFDMSNTVYLAALDISIEVLDDGTACGRGGAWSSDAGRALIPASGNCFNVEVTAHELGHAFGLQHDRRVNGNWISTSYNSDRTTTSFCAAEWLDVHRHFNAKQSSQNASSATVQMFPPSPASPPNGIRLRFEVSDTDGLHQVQLHTPEDSFLIYGGFLACKQLTGTSSIVEFVTTALTPKTESVFLQMIDVHGNFSWSERYPIDITSVLLPPEVVSIPDVNLASGIQHKIGWPITTHTMLNLRFLDVRNANIQNLTGLESAYNLRRLWLGGEWVGNYVNSNAVSNFSPLLGLTQLTSLSLGGNSILDISVLAGLTQLTDLNLDNNSISDISALAGLIQLTDLWLQNNSILDISALTGLTQLTDLNLDNNSVSDISALAGLTQLTELNLDNNSILDISALAGLIQLTDLWLQNNSILDISALAGLTQLTDLNLDNNSVSDISALAGLTQLTELNLVGNSISDISALAGLTQLTDLNLVGNSISDISALAGLTQLTYLNLYNNSVSDISALAANTGLGYGDGVYVQGNPLSYASINRHIPAMQAKGIAVKFDPRTPSTLVKISGTVQQGIVNTTLALPFVVEVRDQRNRAFAEVPITFTITAGGGKLSATDVTTDLTGRAQTRLTLGRTAGTTTVSVAAAAISAPVHFTGTVVPLNSPVTVLDAALRAQIASVLGKPGSGLLTMGDMLGLTALSANNANIRELTGLQYAANLTTLSLDNNNLSDVIPLAGLTQLTSLSLDNNNLSDATLLAGLTQLTTLSLDNNNLSDVASLGGLTQLTTLSLDNNNFSDVSPLAELPQLKTLQLRGNPLNYPSFHTYIPTLQAGGVEVAFDPRTPTTVLKLSGDHGVSGTSLPFVVEVQDEKGLEFSGVPVTFSVTAGGGHLSPSTATTDVTGRARITLTLGGTPGEHTVQVSAAAVQRPVSFTVTAIDGSTPVPIPDAALRSKLAAMLGKPSAVQLTAEDMLTLTRLNARNANIQDLTGLESAYNLSRLWLGGEWVSGQGYVNSNAVSNFSPLLGLTQLTTLDLSGNSILDISALGDLTNLTSLNLYSNSVSDISALVGLTQLTSLNLQDNSISDISALSGLTQLTTLNLGGNSVLDISALGGLTQLIGLHLWYNSISDISALSGLTQLTSLNLQDNSVSDISALSGLTQLTSLNLGGNSILDISALSGLTQLTTLYLWRNSISDVSPLLGLNLTGTQWDSTGLYLRGNPLSYASINTHIPAMQAKGIGVQFDPRTPTTLMKISGTAQQGIVNTTLALPFVVEVRNRYNRAFAEVPVTFAVTAGGGKLSTTTATTDNTGRAETTLTLGPNLGRNTVSVSVTEIKSPVTFQAVSDTFPTQYLWSVPAGVSWIHVPLKVKTVDRVAKSIESVADLYDALGGASSVNLLTTYDLTTRGWHSYLGSSSRGTIADKALTDDTGIIAVMNRAASLHLSGDPLGANGSSTIRLHPGPNLIGLPLRDSRIAQVSDLLTLEGIEGNVSAIMVSDNRRFKRVKQAGDAGDTPITGGQAFILIAREGATVAISGEGWANISGAAATPSVAIMGMEVEDATPVLALWGSMVSPMEWNRRPHLRSGSDFRVIVKNLSTGKTVSTVVGDENLSLPDKDALNPDSIGEESKSDDYQVTVVDIETARAAQIGDILEIAVRSSSPLIGVQPLQYTVTAEDVLRSRIELPALVAYEIPSETELLANYPNPFNPETWIPYRLAEDGFVTLTIYDTAGQVVRTLEVGHRIAAVYERRSKAIHWDGRNDLGEGVASGIYFYTLSAGDYSATRKMVILK